MSPAEAHGRLQFALAKAVTDRSHVPCTGRDGHLFTSDDAEERATAAELCDGCPVLTECALAAESTDERWHVWAGVDRGANPTRKGAKR